MELTIVQMIQSGIFAGIAMSIAAMALQMSGFTKLDLTKYLGCLLTGQTSGNVPFILGVAIHLMFSALFAYIYVQAISYFALPITLQTALILAGANTLFSGIMLKVTDAMNPCIASGKVQAMNFFAYGYGFSGVFTYVLVHVVYAVALLRLFGAPLHF